MRVGLAEARLWTLGLWLMLRVYGIQLVSDITSPPINRAGLRPSSAHRLLACHESGELKVELAEGTLLPPRK